MPLYVPPGAGGAHAASHEDAGADEIDVTGLAGAGGGGGGGAFVGCAAYHNTTQTNPTTVAFNSELFDTDAFHDTSTNNDRITIPAGMGGKYLFTLGGQAGTSAALRLKKNGSTVVGPNWSGAGSGRIAGSIVLDLAAADYITVDVSGSATVGHASAFEEQMQLTAVRLSGGGSYQQAELSADVQITPTNTYVDGPSVTLSVGTWFITATVTATRPSTAFGITIKLWDGTTVVASSQQESTAGFVQSQTVSGVVVIASGTPTWKVSAASVQGASSCLMLAAAASNGAGNNATRIVAIKIA